MKRERKKMLNRAKGFLGIIGALLLLLPIPAYAGLSFSNWALVAGSLNGTGWSQSTGFHDVLTFTPPTTSGYSTDFSLQANISVLAGGSNVTASLDPGAALILQAGTLTIPVTIAGVTPTPGINVGNNQFSVTSGASNGSTVTVEFQLNNSTSSSTPYTLTFTNG